MFQTELQSNEWLDPLKTTEQADGLSTRLPAGDITADRPITELAEAVEAQHMINPRARLKSASYLHTLDSRFKFRGSEVQQTSRSVHRLPGSNEDRRQKQIKEGEFLYRGSAEDEKIRSDRLSLHR